MSNVLALQARGFSWGPVPGLGWGTVLAPVLARLRGIPGVADARVECSGTFFLLSMREEADQDRALHAALGVLGAGARLLSADEARAQLDAQPRGEIWFSEPQIRGLSYLEARIVAGRALAAATQGLSLAGPAALPVAEAIRLEVFAAVDRVHDEGGRASSGWFSEEWPHIVKRVRSRLAGILPEEMTEVVATRLASQH